MASLTYDQLTAITKAKFLPKMVDNIFNSNPLLQRARKKWYEKIDGGERIIVPLNYATVSSSDWYSGSETLLTDDNDVITGAAYTWKQLYANLVINRMDELKNSGDAQVISLVKSKMQIAQKTMEDKLGTGLYSDGTDAKSIVGLRDIVATDQTVGGISQTDYSWWAGQVDSSTTTTTISALQTQFNAAVIGNDAPTVGVSTRAVYNYIYALYQPQQRFLDTETAKGGFSSIMFNSVPIIPDSHCTASHLFFLNEGYLHLWAHKEEDFRLEPWAKPINQNIKKAALYWAGAFGSSNNRCHAKFSGLTA